MVWKIHFWGILGAIAFQRYIICHGSENTFLGHIGGRGEMAPETTKGNKTFSSTLAGHQCLWWCSGHLLQPF